MAKLKGYDHASLDRVLGKRDQVTIGNNTVAWRDGDDGTIYVSLHGHRIIDLGADGTVTIRDCGYRSVTTRDRLNSFVPARYGVVQRQYIWHIADRDNGWAETYWPTSTDVVFKYGTFKFDRGY